MGEIVLAQEVFAEVVAVGVRTTQRTCLDIWRKRSAIPAAVCSCWQLFFVAAKAAKQTSNAYDAAGPTADDGVGGPFATAGLYPVENREHKIYTHNANHSEPQNGESQKKSRRRRL